MAVKGYYHSIETFGTVDGPGIRYVLFLSGCKLQCIFCHNPDTWEQGRQEITVQEVMADVARYRSFYDKSGGGVTVSGGEPLLQGDFVAALFRACRERGIHTLVDTGGYCSLKDIEKVLPYTDNIQISVKAVRPSTHKWLTGADNKTIIDNLRYLALSFIPMTLRYVVIPDINNSVDDLGQLAELVRSLPNNTNIELLAYHTMGVEKWNRIGRQYALPKVREATIEDLKFAKKILQEHGVKVEELG